MATYPALDPVAQLHRDTEHLRYLVIANYIYAAFHALAFLAMIAVLLVVSGAVALGSTDINPEDLPFIGAIGGALALLVALIPLTSTVVQFLLARFLDLRRHHTFCFVVSALNCLSFPFGTLLGILTLVVLARPPVQQMFAEERLRLLAAERATAMGQGG